RRFVGGVAGTRPFALRFLSRRFFDGCPVRLLRGVLFVARARRSVVDETAPFGFVGACAVGGSPLGVFARCAFARSGLRLLRTSRRGFRGGGGIGRRPEFSRSPRGRLFALPQDRACALGGRFVLRARGDLLELARVGDALDS